MPRTPRTKSDGAIGKTRVVLGRRDLIPDIVRSLMGLPDRVAHGLIVKDLDTWVRLEFLGVMAHTGLAASLRTPRTLDDLIDETGVTDRDLLERPEDSVGCNLRFADVSASARERMPRQRLPLR